MGKVHISLLGMLFIDELTILGVNRRLLIALLEERRPDIIIYLLGRRELAKGRCY